MVFMLTKVLIHTLLNRVRVNPNPLPITPILTLYNNTYRYYTYLILLTTFTNVKSCLVNVPVSQSVTYLFVTCSDSFEIHVIKEQEGLRLLAQGCASVDCGYLNPQPFCSWSQTP